MSKFFHNLSMQALSKSDDLILLKLEAINKLNKSRNTLLVNKMLANENAEIEKLQNFFDPPVTAGDGPTIINKIVSTIVKDEKPPSEVDNNDSDISIAKTTEEIEQGNIIQNSHFLET